MASRQIGDTIGIGLAQRLVRKLGPSESHLRKALVAGFWIYAQIFGRLREQFELGDRADFDELVTGCAAEFGPLHADDLSDGPPHAGRPV